MFGDSKEKQLTKYADNLLADGVLTEEEQHQFMVFAQSLGVNLNQYPAILNRIVIANANAGRFPSAAPPFHIMLKAGEEIYLETYASLLKEVADRAWKGGSSGVSFRVAKGVRLRTGQTKGHFQQVGTKTVVTDSGTLSVTSTRIVFSGKTTTQESRYGDVVNLTVRSDGITLAVSKGREVITHAYTTGMGEMVAAVINAAIHQHTAPLNTAIHPQTEPLSNVGILSPDGVWRWDGQSWQPTVGLPSPG
jgi:hypothetical protein